MFNSLNHVQRVEIRVNTKKKKKKSCFSESKINKAPGPDGAPVPKKSSPSISMTIEPYTDGHESTGDNH